MRRTVQTARHIAHQRLEGPGGVEWINMRPKAFKNLDEIYAGVCDGMMYEEVAQAYPEEVRGCRVGGRGRVRVRVRVRVSAQACPEEVRGRLVGGSVEYSTYLLCTLCTL